MGETTHLAARMEQLAGPGMVVVTAATARLVEGHVAVKPMGPTLVKGLADAGHGLRGDGAGRGPGAPRPHRRREVTRLVGRETELGELEQALAAAAGGRGQMVAVVGEAGVGKSRLLSEFVRSLRPAEWRVAETACLSYGPGIGYHPFTAILSTLLGLPDQADPSMLESALGRSLRQGCGRPCGRSSRSASTTWSGRRSSPASAASARSRRSGTSSSRAPAARRCVS